MLGSDYQTMQSIYASVKLEKLRSQSIKHVEIAPYTDIHDSKVSATLYALQLLAEQDFNWTEQNSDISETRIVVT